MVSAVRQYAIVLVAFIAVTCAHAGNLTSTSIGPYVRCPKGDGPVPPTLELRFQPRYTHTDSDADQPQPTWLVPDDRSAKAHYRTRRFRVLAYGDLSSDWAYYAHIRRETDMDSVEWVDAYLTYGSWDFADLTIGQFKTPTEASFTVAEMKWPLYEWPRSAGLLNYDRDWGLMLHDLRRAGGRCGWSVGVFNGEGVNTSENRSTLLWTARFDYAANPRLALGAGYGYNNNTGGNRYRSFLKSGKDPYGFMTYYKAHAVDEETWTLDAHYEDEHARIFAGYLSKDLSSKLGAMPKADDWYVVGGWKIPCGGDPEGLEAVVGFETVDPNTSVRDVYDARFYTIGLNWRPHGTRKDADLFDQVRLQYQKRDERGGSEVDNDSLVIQYEIQWRYR